MFFTKEKIIQLLALPATVAADTFYRPLIYGLSNKGRLFSKPWGEDTWRLMNNGIPEDIT